MRNKGLHQKQMVWNDQTYNMNWIVYFNLNNAETGIQDNIGVIKREI